MVETAFQAKHRPHSFLFRYLRCKRVKVPFSLVFQKSSNHLQKLVVELWQGQKYYSSLLLNQGKLAQSEIPRI